MPTTLLDGETWEQAYSRRFVEEAATDYRVLGTSYFDLAADLMRQQAAIVLRTYEDERSRREIDDDEREYFDRTEAAAINSGA